MFNQQRIDQAPFRQAGLTGLQQYMAMLGLPTQSTQQAGYDPAMAYLQANPDVASDPYYSAHPLDHYNQHGKAEGRAWPSANPSPVGAAGYETGTPANMGGTSLSPLGGGSGNAQQDAFAMFRNTPGYQFGLDEGNKQVQASAAARGGLNSGATLKALMKFGNDYADQQGLTPYMNRLAALSGMAQTSANQMGQAGQNYANQVGQNLSSAGQARAQGIYGSANAWSNYGQQLSSEIGNVAARNNWGGI